MDGLGSLGENVKNKLKGLKGCFSRKSGKKAVLAVLAVVVIAVAAVLSIHIKNKSAMEGRGGARDIFEVVSRQDLSETITASGTVLLEDEIEVYAEGEVNKIKTILVEEGDVVEAGQILVEYDVDDTKEELENKIRDLKRDIASGELALKNLALPAEGSELEKLENAVATAENSLEEANMSYASYDAKISQELAAIETAKRDVSNAERDYNNSLALFEVGGSSQSEIDDFEDVLIAAKDAYDKANDDYSDLLDDKESARLAVIAAENSLKEAQIALSEGKSPMATESKVIAYKQQELSLEALKDSLADYEKDLDELVYTTSAQIGGKVTEVCVDEGTYTEENTVILYVADFDRLIVSADIEEYDAPLLELGQKVSMTSDGLEGKVYTGVITKISPDADDISTNMGTETTVPVEISVDNPDGILKPGYNLDLEITVKENDGVLTVPSGAIFKEDDKSFVYKINDKDILEKTEIKTGESSDVYLEVLEGLSEGERVITTVTDDIKEGMSLEEVVKLKKEQTAASDEKAQQNNQNGGNVNDRGERTNQMLPSGGFGGGGPGGGRPMGQ